MKPILLVPGVFGSRLEVADSASKRRLDDAWISNKLIKPSYIGEAIMKYLWGDYDSAQDWLVSYNRKVDIQAARGLDGCDKLINARALQNPRINRTNFAIYFERMIENFETLGYQRNVNLFGYTYDWRQPLYHEQIIGPLERLIHEIASASGRKLLVVAHSMGGLVMLRYMQARPDWGKYIDRLACLGTPFDGSSGYALLSTTHGYNLRQPIRQSAFRGFQSRSPAILWLYPYPWHSAPIDSKIYFRKRRFGAQGTASELVSSSTLHMDDEKLCLQGCDHAEQRIAWEDVILDARRYGSRQPDVCFFILDKLKSDYKLLTKDVDYWILRLQRGCRFGTVKIRAPGRLNAAESDENRHGLERASRKRADKILGKNFKYGVPSLAELQSTDSEWRCYGFAGTSLSGLPPAQRRLRTRGAANLQKPALDFHHIVRFSEHRDLFDEAVRLQLYLEQTSEMLVPDLLRDCDGRIVRTYAAQPKADGSLFPVSPTETSSSEYEVAVPPAVDLGTPPWRQDLKERCIFELFAEMCPAGTLENALFNFDLDMLKAYQKQVSVPAKLVFQDDFLFLSVCGSGLPTPLHMYFPRPVGSLYELGFQQPQSVDASGDSTVLLPSALSDPIPDRYVYDRVVIPGLRHLRMLYDETVFFLLRDFLRK